MDSNIIMRVLYGPIFFQAMRSGVQFNLFTILKNDGPLTLDQISHKLEIKKQPARILASALTSCGLLNRTTEENIEPRYSNSDEADTFLCANSPIPSTWMVEWIHALCYKPLFHTHQAFVQGTNIGLKELPGTEATIYERLAHDPEYEKIFALSMQEISKVSLPSFIETVDLSHVKHILDVGGSNGTNLIGLKKRWPHIKGTVFDRPTVCDIAQFHISTHNLEDSLDAVAGNCFEDPFPKNIDCVMFCHFNCIWSEEQNRLLYRKSYEALPKGGSIVLFDTMLDEDDSGPLPPAALSVYFQVIATGIGMCYSVSEHSKWLREAGFQDLQVTNLMYGERVFVARK